MKAFKYQLAFWTRMTAITFAVMISNMIIAGTIVYLINRFQPSAGVTFGSIDSIAAVSFFIYGLIFFKPCLKFLLANGVSRRRFFWANLPLLAMVAVSNALAIKLFQFIFGQFTSYTLVYEFLYRGASVLGGVVWLSALIFMLVLLGWFITMVYYRSGNKLKIIISISPVLLLTFLTGLNRLTGGTVFREMGWFFDTAMGFSGGVPNPYTAAFSMLLFAIVLGGLNFLLIQKAPLKD